MFCVRDTLPHWHVRTGFGSVAARRLGITINKFLAGDDDRVKTEKESGEYGREQPEEDATIHRWKELMSQ